MICVQICVDLVRVGFTSTSCHFESVGTTVPFDVKTSSGWKLGNEVSGAVRISHGFSGSQLTVHCLLSLFTIEIVLLFHFLQSFFYFFLTKNSLILTWLTLSCVRRVWQSLSQLVFWVRRFTTLYGSPGCVSFVPVNGSLVELGTKLAIVLQFLHKCMGRLVTIRIQYQREQVS